MFLWRHHDQLPNCYRLVAFYSNFCNSKMIRRFRHDNTTFCQNYAKCREAGYFIPQSNELRRWRSLYYHDHIRVIAPSNDETGKEIKVSAQMEIKKKPCFHWSPKTAFTETFSNFFLGCRQHTFKASDLILLVMDTPRTQEA